MDCRATPAALGSTSARDASVGRQTSRGRTGDGSTLLAASAAATYAARMNRNFVPSLLSFWLATIASVAMATGPLPPERLIVRRIDGASVPFSESLGADGVAVCFAFLHPSCPLAQDYAPVLEALSRRFAESQSLVFQVSFV